jgi:predicted esterase
MVTRSQDALVIIPACQVDSASCTRDSNHPQWRSVLSVGRTHQANHIGMRMPGWFDLSSLDDLTDSQYDDEQGLLKSVEAVDKLVQAEIDSGIPENKIVVGGFSQGGAIAMLYGLTKGRDLAGMVGLSTWVVLNHKIAEVSTLSLKVPNLADEIDD